MKKKWKESSYSEQKFLNKNKNWLNNELEWCESLPLSTENVAVSASASTSGSTGRPMKNFNDLSDRAKRKRTENLRAAVGTDELVSAAISSLHVNGQRAAADVVAEATQFSPMRPVKMKQQLKEKKGKKEGTPYTPEEALAMYIDNRLSKKTYLNLRKGAQLKGYGDMYPSYHKLLEAKKRCYPEGIKITESGKHCKRKKF